MLRITTSKGAAAASNYFSKGLAQQDYYTKDGVSSRWCGKLAPELELSGRVEAYQFHALTRNRHPSTNQKLTPRDSANRRVGYDLTFSAPKTASIAMELTGDTSILDAHRRAVTLAMAAVERDSKTLVGKGTQKTLTPTGQMIWAEFDHFTSRPTPTDNGPDESDPQLHTHAFAFNVTRDNRSGGYRALEMGGIVRSAEYYESLYHGSFAYELSKAGYTIERDGRFWDIRGFTPELKAKYSTRSTEINKAIQQEQTDGKRLTTKQRAAMGARTRAKKDKDIYSPDQLRRRWHERLSPEEKAFLSQLKHIDKSGAGETKNRELTPQRCIDHALNHHLERKSAVAEKKLLADAMRRGFGEIAPVAIEASATKHKDIIRADRHYDRFVTTGAMVAAESEILTRANRGKNTCPAINSDYQIQNEILNEQQREAINHLLTSTDRVMILSGAAGVGKSTLLSEVHQGVKQNGKTVHAFAPSAEASRNVLREKGFENADTIASFLLDTKRQEAVRDQVILIDEAGMVDTKTMAQLTRISEDKNARLILSGDPRQHSSVNAGDAMYALQKRSSLPVARVDKIVRQRSNPQYKRAIEDLAQGHVKQGFERLDRSGAIIEIENTKQRTQAVANAYLESVNARRTALVVSPTHREGQEISQAIRGRLREDKRLSKKERMIDVQTPLSFTQAQKSDPSNYKPGMILQYHQNAPNFKAGQRYSVSEVNDEQIVLNDSTGAPLLLDRQHADRFSVFRTSTLPVSKGELIRLTANGRTLEGKRVNNGQTHTVRGFTKNGDIKLEGGHTLAKDFANIKHGYVRTSHASQGKDAQDVIISQSSTSLPAGNEKQFYVSASRGVQTCKIFTHDRAELLNAVRRSGERVSALEIYEKDHNSKKNSTCGAALKRKRSLDPQRVKRHADSRDLANDNEQRTHSTPLPAQQREAHEYVR